MRGQCSGTAGSTRQRCTWSPSRHPGCGTNTWDLPWAGMPGDRACQSHPAALRDVGPPDRNGVMLPEPLARSQPPPSPREINTKQSSEDCTCYPTAPGTHGGTRTVGHRQPVPALGDTTAAAPAAPAPAPGAQLRPRLPQAEILRQLPKRGHGSRCPWVPGHAGACYTPAVPAASPGHRREQGCGTSTGQELSHQ